MRCLRRLLRCPQAEAASAFPDDICDLWDLALGINRSDPAAVAIAQNGANGKLAVDPAELKKLMGTVWFRPVFQRFSEDWRERMLDVLVESVVVPDHVVKVGRREIHLHDIGHAELKELFSKSSLTEIVVRMCAC